MGMIKLPDRSLDLFQEKFGDIFSSGALAEGDWNESVARFVADYSNAPYALALNSNGSGLLAILMLMKRYRGKKRVVLQSNTMYGVKTIANSSGLSMNGFIDCEMPFLMPTLDNVKEFFEPIAKKEEFVFLLTHIGGWVNPEIRGISSYCKAHDIALVEDCAHSLGATLDGEHTGLFGDAGVYSLYATKAIPVGEGGILVTKDSDLYEKSKRFIMYDRIKQEIDIGINLRMSELNALLAHCVLLEIENIIGEKHATAERYNAVCLEHGISFLAPNQGGQRANLYKYIVLTDGTGADDYFQRVTNRTSPVYDYALGRDLQGISRNHICLPIWYRLEKETIEETVAQLADNAKNHRPH